MWWKRIQNDKLWAKTKSRPSVEQTEEKSVAENPIWAANQRGTGTTENREKKAVNKQINGNQKKIRILNLLGAP